MFTMSEGNDNEVASGGRCCPTMLTMADVNDEDATSGGRRRPTPAGKRKIVFRLAGTRSGTQRPTVVVETVDENSLSGGESSLGSENDVASKDDKKDPKGRPVVLRARQRAIRRAAAARRADKDTNAKATR